MLILADVYVYPSVTAHGHLCRWMRAHPTDRPNALLPALAETGLRVQLGQRLPDAAQLFDQTDAGGHKEQVLTGQDGGGRLRLRFHLHPLIHPLLYHWWQHSAERFRGHELLRLGEHGLRHLLGLDASVLEMELDLRKRVREPAPESKRSPAATPKMPVGSASAPVEAADGLEGFDFDALETGLTGQAFVRA